MTATVVKAVLRHVAGPPEKEPTDNKAGWTWTQRCLRCDTLLNPLSGWWPLGCGLVELDTGAFAGDGAATGLVPQCDPEPIRPPTLVIEAEE